MSRRLLVEFKEALTIDLEQLLKFCTLGTSLASPESCISPDLPILHLLVVSVYPSEKWKD